MVAGESCGDAASAGWVVARGRECGWLCAGDAAFGKPVSSMQLHHLEPWPMRLSNPNALVSLHVRCRMHMSGCVRFMVGD